MHQHAQTLIYSPTGHGHDVPRRHATAAFGPGEAPVSSVIL